MAYNQINVFNNNYYIATGSTITTTDGSVNIGYAGVWDGTTGSDGWSSLDGGINTGYARGMRIYSTSRIYIFGAFSNIGDSVTVSHSSNFSVAMWDGTKWNSLGSVGTTNGVVHDVAYDSDNNLLYAVGTFTTIYGTSARRVAVFNGTSWSALRNGANSTVYSCDLDGSNNLYIGGAFSLVTNLLSVLNTAGVAKWDKLEAEWVSLSSGIFGSTYTVRYNSSANEIYYSGSFPSLGGVSNTKLIAKYSISSSSWSSIGTFNSISDSRAYTFELGTGGAIYVGGEFVSNGTDVAYRNSSGTWTNLGASPYTFTPTQSNFQPIDMAVDSNGNVLVSRNAGGLYILKRDTTSWLRLDNLSANIYPVAVVIANITPSSSSATLTVDSAMTNITFTNSGDDATFTISPSLPAGLSINSSTGTISGTPTVTTDGSVTHTISATNDAGTDTATVSIRVNNAVTVANITPSSSSATLTVDSAMTDITFTNSGDDATFTISPSLPAGLSINSSNGTISGTPTATTDGSVTHTISATNDAGTDTATVSIRVNSAVTVANITPSSSSATLTVDSAMTNITFTNSGDDATFTISPSLPAGLSINSSNGTISGTPTATTDGSVTHTISATNDAGTDTATVSIRVNNAVTVANITPSSSSATLTVDSAMTDITFTNSGDDATFTISPSLPAGLSINSSNGTISGTPTETTDGSVTHTISATNDAGTDTATVSIRVNSAVTVANITPSSSSATLTVDSAMTNITFTNSGDDATFTISPSLPAGLSINSSNGTISGTPTGIVFETTTYTITATNDAGTDTATVRIRVHDTYISRALGSGIATDKVMNAMSITLPDSTSSNVMLNLSLDNEVDEMSKMEKRRTALELIFTRTNNLSKRVFKTNCSELGIDSSFTKTDLLVYANNQVIDFNTIDETTGVYANVYNSGETATFLNVGGSQTIIFTAGGDGTYTATIDGISTLDTYTAGATYVISGCTWTMGSIYSDGDSAISNICLNRKTKVLTTEGYVSIEKINNKHIIEVNDNLYPIHCLVKRTNPTYLMIVFEKDSLGLNIPFKRTLITHNHKINYKGKWIMAKKFVNGYDIKVIKTDEKHIYNILLKSKNRGQIDANGMIVESLDPDNETALLHFPKNKNKL